MRRVHEALDGRRVEIENFEIRKAGQAKLRVWRGWLCSFLSRKRTMRVHVIIRRSVKCSGVANLHVPIKNRRILASAGWPDSQRSWWGCWNWYGHDPEVEEIVVGFLASNRSLVLYAFSEKAGTYDIYRNVIKRCLHSRGKESWKIVLSSWCHLLINV